MARAEQDDAGARLRAVIGRLGRSLRPTRAGSGLSPSQISVLFTVVRDGAIPLAELAEFCQLCMAPFAMEQRTAKLFLQLLDRAGERRLGHVACLGCTGEAQGPGKLNEISDLIEFHAS